MASYPQLDGIESRVETRPRRRAWIAFAALGTLILLVLLPPYLNVNRYRRRITTSISESLGRPVHLDHVALHLLPVPGFTLDNFVVSEDPHFGAEPTIRANTVRATLRVSTLWRRRIEFSTISLTDPSINLVHTARGEWNLDSILLQASHLQAAPTAQKTAGAAPRFPYIEATGARLNLKLDEVKTPFSLTEADFALWLPSPQTWRVRIAARPARTDVPLGYTGVLKLEGTLGRAQTLAQIPIDLHGEWRAVPLGEVSRVVLGRDAGWRGEMTLSVSATGTVAENEMHTRVQFEDLRRADFVPARPLATQIDCIATVTNLFHSVIAAHCVVPSGARSNFPALELSGALADVRQLQSGSLAFQLPPTPAADLADLVKMLSARAPADLKLGGTLSGSARFDGRSPAPDGGPPVQGTIVYRGGSVATGSGDKTAISIGDAVLQPTPDGVALAPTELSLGGKEPAMLDGHFNRSGYVLHLSGTVTPERLAALRTALPQLGAGLAEALPAANSTGPLLHLDMVATRSWGGRQTWQAAVPRPARPRKPSKRPGR